LWCRKWRSRRWNALPRGRKNRTVGGSPQLRSRRNRGRKRCSQLRGMNMRCGRWSTYLRRRKNRTTRGCS
jgi:hypothetical protein